MEIGHVFKMYSKRIHEYMYFRKVFENNTNTCIHNLSWILNTHEYSKKCNRIQMNMNTEYEYPLWPQYFTGSSYCQSYLFILLGQSCSLTQISAGSELLAVIPFYFTWPELLVVIPYYFTGSELLAIIPYYFTGSDLLAVIPYCFTRSQLMAVIPYYFIITAVICPHLANTDQRWDIGQ